jgi:hypothetical protein
MISAFKVTGNLVPVHEKTGIDRIASITGSTSEEGSDVDDSPGYWPY